MFLKEHKKLFISSIIVISLVLILLSAMRQFTPTWFNTAVSVVITPVERFVSGIGSSVSGFFGGIAHMGTLQSENASLKAQVESLTAENIRLKQVDDSNKRLTELLDISKRYTEYPMVGSYVTGDSTDNWFNTFTIDKGSRDNISIDMAVLASGGLCGRIYEVGYNYSKVRPIIDDTSSIAAEDSRTGDTGFVRGDLKLMLDGLCIMDFISAEAAIRPGDELITGRLSTVYPPGIIIGEVVSVTPLPNGTKQAIVKPYVNFKHIEAVVVITELFKTVLIPNPTPTPSSTPTPTPTE